jgi:Tetratricopeptide repeat/TIR domain/NB-ARC domain/AAA domain
MSEPDRQGQVVTFYAYKGGTGRTMALANVAWILASNGKKVLAVDWDLESPGLHKFFHPFLSAQTVSATRGVIEMINDYTTAALEPQPGEADWHLELARVLPHAVPLDWRDFPEDGCLDFISAGRQNLAYSAAVISTDWDNFYDRLHGGRFFSAMREDMKAHYDYILIDSRTGLSDVADICTIELPDILVVCFTLSDQSIEGAADVASTINKRYRDRNIRILPVPTRIENGEKEKLNVGRSVARQKFAGLPEGLSEEETQAYWGSVEVPYEPFYAFEETLATFRDEPGSPRSLLASFERIADFITQGEVTSMPPLDEELRLQYLNLFTRRLPMSSSDVFLSYVPEDRFWAEWMESVLTSAGFRVRLRGLAGVGAQDVDRAPEPQPPLRSWAVAVLSSAYLQSSGAGDAWAAMVNADAGGTRSQLVTVLVDAVHLEEPFAQGAVVDVAGLDVDQATEQLLQAFGRPVPAPRSPDSLAGPRFPGANPQFWNIPARNELFTGRGVLLEQLRNKLAERGTTITRAQALCGMGGVGKTQIALEYAYRFKADYDIIWWVPAEQNDELTVALAELAQRLGLKVGDNLADAASAALEKLRFDSDLRWLLIFDNADDPKDLKAFHQGGTGDIIVTSRNQAWAQAGQSLEVDVFTRQESVAHLVRHVPSLAVPDADEIAKALGDLPLAIEQAGAWLEQTGMPAATYVEQLQEQSTLITALKQLPDSPVPVVATWNLSLERLKERSPAAVRLLQLCAFFSAGPISMTLLYSDEMIESLLPFDETLTEKVVLGKVIRDISRFALARVDRGRNSLQLHRLVQAVIRSQLTPEERIAACHEVHKILIGARPRRGDTDDPENWDRYKIIWPHLGPSRAEECEEDRTRQLLIDWVRYLWKMGEFEACLGLGQRLLGLWQGHLGDDHIQTLHLQFHIANVLRSQGRFSEARDLDQCVLESQRATLPPDHVHTLMTAGGLAADLRALGEFQQALSSDRETYEHTKDLFGDDHPRTLAAANNLAVSLRLVGDCFGAQRLDEVTLARRRTVLGPDHPYTLYSAANLARDKREAGAFRDSVTLLRTTLQQYREVLGDELPDTLRTAKSLAVSLRKNGQQLEAMSLTQDTYERYLRRYKADSPDVLSCLLNLACDYSALNDKEQAQVEVTEVMEAYERSLGSDHPYTLVAANNLVTYLRGGELTRARLLAEETLANMTRKLGDRHPFTLSCAINVANCLGDCEELDDAEALERQTLGKLQQTLGARHPDALVCEANLAVTLRMRGQEGTAESIRARLLTEFDQVLGPRHPNAVLVQNWQRINRDLEPQPT